MSCTVLKSSEHVQLGMLMPAGIPLPAKVRTSSEVKSGLRNVSFSNSLGQGSCGSKTSAELTSLANRSLIALFTTATKPDDFNRETRVEKFKTALQDCDLKNGQNAGENVCYLQTLLWSQMDLCSSLWTQCNWDGQETKVKTKILVHCTNITKLWRNKMWKKYRDIFLHS